MSTDPARPGRIAGLALLGVAAVATVIGVVTLTGGDDDPQADTSSPPSVTNQPQPSTSGPPQSTTSAASTPPPTTAPTTSPPASTTPPTATPTTQPTQPGQPGPGQPAPGQPGAPTTREQPIRVYNNSNVKGLGDRITADLGGRGWNVVETANYSGGTIPTTTVYYRPNTAEEAAARELGTQFGIRVEPRFEGLKDSSLGLIVIVTREYAGPAGKE
ncbi:MAG: LytR C-terminal domain-containing protein [Actinomycetota bacterium]|nr:LytR C-terminal domain-containing protein [Actinomycetota bacterium]